MGGWMDGWMGGWMEGKAGLGLLTAIKKTILCDIAGKGVRKSTNLRDIINGWMTPKQEKSILLWEG